MTITPVEGIHSGSFKLKMPSKTRMAVRMQKVDD
jgi:hypothetical protein